MKVKVVDTPDELFEYTTDVIPRKDEFIYHKDQWYKVSYVCHHVDEARNTDTSGEAYAVIEVSTTRPFLGQELKSY